MACSSDVLSSPYPGSFRALMRKKSRRRKRRTSWTRMKLPRSRWWQSCWPKPALPASRGCPHLWGCSKSRSVPSCCRKAQRLKNKLGNPVPYLTIRRCSEVLQLNEGTCCNAQALLQRSSSGCFAERSTLSAFSTYHGTKPMPFKIHSLAIKFMFFQMHSLTIKFIHLFRISAKARMET